jgi:hypothetical protein
MPAMIDHLLSLVYALVVLLLALHALGQALLVARYLTRGAPATPPPPAPPAWPAVTIQLPVYNEPHVIEALLAAAAAIDYPRGQLLIQVLDDSTDGSSAFIASRLAGMARGGLRTQHLRREGRAGYKAGALAAGLAQADSPFVAIFDADFRPPPDFLRRTVPLLLADERLALVQARWGHTNADHNAITQAQALAIDAHFVVEQVARACAGWLVPFNGSAGIWRVAAIQDAGGWSDRTLTEDFDLSYRAGLRGWRAAVLPDLVVAGEIPPSLPAYQQQQMRWATGSTQNLRLLAPGVLRARLPLLPRLMALHHLAQYLPHVWMLAVLLLTPLLVKTGGPGAPALAPLGLLALIPPLVYGLGQRALYPGGYGRMAALPALITIGAATTLRNSIAVMAGLRPHRAIPFRRTPKIGASAMRASIDGGDGYALLELALAAYALWGISLAWPTQPAAVLFLGLYALAFLASVATHLMGRLALAGLRVPPVPGELPEGTD